MQNDFHFIETQIYYLLPEEGGRQNRLWIWSGYRGQFTYAGEDYDGVQYFPDRLNQYVPLGTTLRVLVGFNLDRWKAVHADNIQVGMAFEIREGRRTVGRRTVTAINANDEGRMLKQIPIPELAMGQQVRVILNEHNFTPREGTVCDVVWHHKDACFYYFLNVGGKRVSKRYRVTDLELMDEDQRH